MDNLRVLFRLRKAFQGDLFRMAKPEQEQLNFGQSAAKIGEVKQFGPSDWRMLLVSPSGKARWMDMKEAGETARFHKEQKAEHERHAEELQGKAVTPLIPYAKYQQQDIETGTVPDPTHTQIGDLYFTDENPLPPELKKQHDEYMRQREEHISASKDHEQKGREFEAARDILSKKATVKREQDRRDEKEGLEKGARLLENMFGNIQKRGVQVKLESDGKKSYYRLSGKTFPIRREIAGLPGTKFEDGTWRVPPEQMLRLDDAVKSRLARFFRTLFGKSAQQERLFEAGEPNKVPAKPKKDLINTPDGTPIMTGEVREFAPGDKRQLKVVGGRLNGMIRRWVSMDDDKQLGLDFRGKEQAAGVHAPKGGEKPDEEKMSTEAKRLGIEYAGPQKFGVETIHVFQDPVSKGSFSVKPGQDVEKELTRKRTEIAEGEKAKKSNPEGKSGEAVAEAEKEPTPEELKALSNFTFFKKQKGKGKAQGTEKAEESPAEVEGNGPEIKPEEKGEAKQGAIDFSKFKPKKKEEKEGREVPANVLAEYPELQEERADSGIEAQKATGAQQKEALGKATVGKGQYKPFEVYSQEIQGVGTRPVQITKVNEDGTLDGWYVGSPTAEGLGGASLLPGTWKKEELQTPTYSDERLKSMIDQLFHVGEGTEKAVPKSGFTIGPKTGAKREIHQISKEEYMKGKKPTSVAAMDFGRLAKDTGIKSEDLNANPSKLDSMGRMLVVPREGREPFSKEEDERLRQALFDQGYRYFSDYAPNTLGTEKLESGYRIEPMDVHEVIHRNAVKNAVARGAQVPEEVMKDYPEFQNGVEQVGSHAPKKVNKLKEKPAEGEIFDLRDPKHIAILSKLNEGMPEGAEILPHPDTKLPFESDKETIQNQLDALGYKFGGVLLHNDEEGGEPVKHLFARQTKKPMTWGPTMKVERGDQ